MNYLPWIIICLFVGIMILLELNLKSRRKRLDKKIDELEERVKKILKEIEM